MKNQKENIWVIISFVFVVFLIGLIMYLLMRGTTKIDQDIVLPQNNEVNTIDSKEEQKDIKINNVNNNKNNMEKIAKNGDVLVMNYTGRLTDGTVFDSNVDPKFGHVEPFQFTLGSGQVIQGWEEGLIGMKIGEKKTLTIPPEKAYGNRAIGNLIPANSTLIFDVELVDIQ